MDRFDHLENFWNRKVKAEATKNAIDDAGDKIRKDQARIFLLFFIPHPVLFQSQPAKKCEMGLVWRVE